MALVTLQDSNHGKNSPYASAHILSNDNDVYVPAASTPTANMVTENPASASSGASYYAGGPNVPPPLNTAPMGSSSFRNSASPYAYGDSPSVYTSATTPMSSYASPSAFAPTPTAPTASNTSCNTGDLLSFSSSPPSSNTANTTAPSTDLVTTPGSTMTTYTIPPPHGSATSTMTTSSSGRSVPTGVHGGEHPLAKKSRRRRRRRLRMAAAGTGGVVVGGLVLGPVGAVAGAVGAVAATRGISKHREKKKDERNAAKETAAIPVPAQTGVSA